MVELHALSVRNSGHEPDCDRYQIGNREVFNILRKHLQLEKCPERYGAIVEVAGSHLGGKIVPVVVMARLRWRTVTSLSMAEICHRPVPSLIFLKKGLCDLQGLSSCLDIMYPDDINPALNRKG